MVVVVLAGWRRRPGPQLSDQVKMERSVATGNWPFCVESAKAFIKFYSLVFRYFVNFTSHELK